MAAGESHHEETGWYEASLDSASRPAHHGRGDEAKPPEPIYVHVAYRRDLAPTQRAAADPTAHA